MNRYLVHSIVAFTSSSLVLAASDVQAQESEGCQTYSFNQADGAETNASTRDVCEEARLDWVRNRHQDVSKNGFFDNTQEDIDLCFVCDSASPVLRLIQPLNLKAESDPTIMATVQVLSSGDESMLSGQDQGESWLFQYEPDFVLERGDSEVLKNWVTVEYDDGEVISSMEMPLYILVAYPEASTRTKPDVVSCSSAPTSPTSGPSNALWTILLVASCWCFGRGTFVAWRSSC